jgi:uncharacterized membrane protein
MRFLWRFLKATLIGGFLFLVPLILFVVVIGKGVELAKKVVGPAVAHLPNSIGGVAVKTLAAAALLAVLALVVGLFAQTGVGRRVKDWLESTILGKIPAYSIVRGMLEPSGVVDERAKPALAWVEESWVYALVMEIHEDGHRTVFVPGAPSPLSGSLYFLPENRVRPLDVPLPTFLKEIRSMGVGSRKLLEGRLGPP